MDRYGNRGGNLGGKRLIQAQVTADNNAQEGCLASLLGGQKYYSSTEDV